MTFSNCSLTENEIKESICKIDSMIREYDYHESYDIFSQKEVIELIKLRNDLKNKLRGIKNDQD